MAENTEVKSEVTPESDTPKVTEMEQRAMSMGWRPKEEWSGNDDDFIDAKEFVRRKPLFDKIDSTTKRLKSVEETMNQLASHHQKVKEVEFQRALKQLRQEKRTALKDGDTVVALELEDKMDELTEARQVEEKELRQQIASTPQTQISPEFSNWVKYNDWYLKDLDMHDFADGVATSFIKRCEQEGKVLTETEVFSHVLEKTKRAYPDKFENPNRSRPSAVSGGDRNGKATKSVYKLSDEEESIARNFEKQGIMTRDEYIAERKSLQGDE